MVLLAKGKCHRAVEVQGSISDFPRMPGLEGPTLCAWTGVPWVPRPWLPIVWTYGDRQLHGRSFTTVAPPTGDVSCIWNPGGGHVIVSVVGPSITM